MYSIHRLFLDHDHFQTVANCPSQEPKLKKKSTVEGEREGREVREVEHESITSSQNDADYINKRLSKFEFVHHDTHSSYALTKVYLFF